MRRGPFLLIFALSGMSALIYEVVWTRLLTLTIGHGVAAASTVLAAFMGGLAAGAAAGGRVGQRLDPRGALRLYAVIEMAIAGAAVAVPLLLIAVQPLMAAAYRNGDGGIVFGALRLGTSLLLLSLPAAAMGATLPVAARAMVRDASSLSEDAGRLYAANTIGASAGALGAGFVLLPLAGLAGATAVGVALNLLAAAGAWWIAGHVPDRTASAETPPAPMPRRRNKKPAKSVMAAAVSGRPGLAALALCGTGAASLALQVVWTRLLASILGPTTYAFSAVVATFILGIAGGAALGARLSRAFPRPAAILAIVVIVSGALALAAASAVDAALLAIGRLVATPGITFESVVWREVLLAAALLMPMALCFGAAFPLALAVASRSNETVVSDLGYVYAANTVGAIAGALLSGFILIPLVGLHGTIRLSAAATALVGVAIAVASRGQRGWAAAGLVGVAGLAAAWLAPGWNPKLLSSGAYKYAATLRGPDLETALTAGELVYYREGATATVAVRRLAGTTSLAIDGKVDASDAGDMLTQRLLAHIPLLLHPQPRTAAILGLGSGVTLGSALTHGLDRGVVLEISDEVVEASRFFERENHQVLSNPKTRLVVGDGRTHLLLSDERYDVIVSEPSNPWMAGIAALFTREFFEIARSRLTPGGVLCQWAHTYDMSEADLRSIVATFMSVFPDGSLWLVGEGDVMLVGSSDPISGRLGQVAEHWQRPGVAADLSDVGATDPMAVLALFVAEGRALADWSSGAPIQTDSRAQLEFSGPRSVFGAAAVDNARTLRELGAASGRPPAVTHALASATADQWAALGDMQRRAGGHAAAYDAFAQALEREPNHPLALDGILKASVPLQRIPVTRDLLTRLASGPGNTEAKIALSRLLAGEGRFDESASVLLSLLRENPGQVPVLDQLASVLSDAGDAERLAPVVARLRVEAPASATTHFYAATLGFLQQRPDIAVREAEAALAVEPAHAKARNILGAALAGIGQRDRARAAFAAAIQADPRAPPPHPTLATLDLEAGDRSAARRYFAEALTIDPENAAARQGLAAILDAR